MNEQQLAAVKQALEVLEYIDLCDNDRDFLQPHECFQLDEAITALQSIISQDALEKMAENARELGLSYEPEEDLVDLAVKADNWGQP
jgi:hypothetical protein